MDRMDDMSQDIGKYNTYCRNLSKQTQQKQQVHLFFSSVSSSVAVDLMRHRSVELAW